MQLNPRTISGRPRAMIPVRSPQLDELLDDRTSKSVPPSPRPGSSDDWTGSHRASPIGRCHLALMVHTSRAPSCSSGAHPCCRAAASRPRRVGKACPRLSPCAPARITHLVTPICSPLHRSPRLRSSCSRDPRRWGGGSAQRSRYRWRRASFARWLL